MSQGHVPRGDSGSPPRLVGAGVEAGTWDMGCLCPGDLRSLAPRGGPWTAQLLVYEADQELHPTKRRPPVTAWAQERPAGVTWGLLAHGGPQHPPASARETLLRRVGQASIPGPGCPGCPTPSGELACTPAHGAQNTTSQS